MVKISEDFVLRLKNSCDIVSVFSSYVDLKSSGKNKKCSCPFHSEKTPSMVVYEDTQSFYCFGCGVGGDVITFIEKIENLTYVDAVKLLADRAGISIPTTKLDDKFSKQRSRILEMNKIAAKFFFNNLKLEVGRIGLEYFAKRGLSRDIIIKFGLGYADGSWDSLKNHLKLNGFSLEEMCDADLVIKSKKDTYYDKFRNRVMFPIIDIKGNVIGFGGRVLDDSKPKYLNSSDTHVFKKSMGLYALNFAKNSGSKTLILCEGYMDVISMHQNGFNNSIAALGTSLTESQVRLISRNSNDVVIVFDSDEAGNVAMDRAYKMFLDIGVKPRALRLKGAKDPDEYIKKYGASRMKVLINQSKSAMKMKIDAIEEKYNLDDVEQRKDYINQYCLIISDIFDSLEREVYIGELCRKMKITREVVSNHVEYLLKKKRKKYGKKIDRELVKNVRLGYIGNKTYSKYDKAEQGVIRFLYNNPDYINYLSDKFDEDWFTSDLNKKIYRNIVDKINLGNSLDFVTFHGILSSDEMGLFSKIINEGKNYVNTNKELDDYIYVMKEKYDKQNENISSMTLEQIEKRRKQTAQKKRGFIGCSF